MTDGDLRILARQPILFDAEGGEAVHAPLIVTRVAGVEARFILDTGSEVHLLTTEHTDRAGLDLAPGEEGTDHSGAVIPSWLVEDVTMQVGGEAVVLHGVVAIPAPAPFPGWGIGGIVSPQHLHPSATAVIDLVQDELLLVEGDDDAVAALLASRRPDATILTLERVPEFSCVVVCAAVHGYPEVPTILNTGGRNTEFARAAVPGLVHGVPEAIGAGVSGADVTGATAGAQSLVVAGHTVPVASLAVRESVPDPPGLVGMDVLRGTVLACTADLERHVLWQI